MRTAVAHRDAGTSSAPLIVTMTDSHVLPLAIVTSDEIDHFRQQFDSLHQQLSAVVVNSVQEDSGRKRAEAERDAATQQVAHLQSQLQKRQQEYNQLISAHQMEVERLKLDMLQHVAQQDAQLSAVMSERDLYKQELDHFLTQESSDTRIHRMEQQFTDMSMQIAELQQGVVQIEDRVQADKKVLLGAKLIVVEVKQQAAKCQQERDAKEQELADLKQQFVVFTTRKDNASDTDKYINKLRAENERLQRLVAQVRHTRLSCLII